MKRRRYFRTYWNIYWAPVSRCATVVQQEDIQTKVGESWFRTYFYFFLRWKVKAKIALSETTSTRFTCGSWSVCFRKKKDIPAISSHNISSKRRMNRGLILAVGFLAPLCAVCVYNIDVYNLHINQVFNSVWRSGCSREPCPTTTSREEVAGSSSAMLWQQRSCSDSSLPALFSSDLSPLPRHPPLFPSMSAFSLCIVDLRLVADLKNSKSVT